MPRWRIFSLAWGVGNRDFNASTGVRITVEASFGRCWAWSSKPVVRHFVSRVGSTPTSFRHILFGLFSILASSQPRLAQFHAAQGVHIK